MIITGSAMLAHSCAAITSASMGLEGPSSLGCEDERSKSSLIRFMSELFLVFNKQASANSVQGNC